MRSFAYLYCSIDSLLLCFDNGCLLLVLFGLLFSTCFGVLVIGRMMLASLCCLDVDVIVVGLFSVCFVVFYCFWWLVGCGFCA